MYIPISMKLSLFFSFLCLHLTSALNTTTFSYPWNPPLPAKTKCEQVMMEVCPHHKTECQDLWEIVYSQVSSSNNGFAYTYKIWVRKPKVSSCLELVRSGDLNITDAKDSFSLWGLQNDEAVDRKLVLLKAMTDKEDEEVKPTPTRSPYGEMHTPLPDEKDEFDLGDLGVLMSIIKGLGLQLPADDNDTVTVGANDKKVEEIFDKPDMTEEQILGLFSGFLKAGEGEGEKGENMREIEWLLENDPAAAAELLKPLLAGGDEELQEYLKNVTDADVTSEDVDGGGKNGTVLTLVEDGAPTSKDRESDGR